MTRTVRLLPLAALVAATALWGSVVVLVKVAARGVPVITVTAVEVLVAVVVLVAVQALRRVPLRRPRPALLVAALLEPGLAYPLINLGLAHTSGDHAAVLIGTESVFVVVGAAALARTWPRARVLLALALTVVGAALLSGSGGGHATVGGDAMVAAGVVLASGYVLLAQRFPADQDAISATLVQFAVGCLGTAPIVVGAVARSPHLRTVWLHPTAGEVAAALAVGVLGSAGAFVLYNWALPQVHAAVAGTSLGLIPVFGVAASAIFLGEPVTAVVLGATAAVVVGVALTAHAEPRPAGGDGSGDAKHSSGEVTAAAPGGRP